MKLLGITIPKDLALVLQFTSDYFDVSVEELRGKSRKREIAYPRHFSRYISWKYLRSSNSLAVIGSVTRADHATVLNSKKRVENSLETESNKNNTWGWYFKMAEEKFIEDYLSEVNQLSKIRKKYAPKNTYKKILKQQEKDIRFKEGIISEMYNSFLLLANDLKKDVDEDHLVAEGYLKARAKRRIENRVKNIRNIKFKVRYK